MKSGTIVRGVRAPIIRKGDDLVKIVVESIDECIKEANIELNDHDVIAVTEAVVAKAQGNYASVDVISCDIATKYPSGTIGLIFPILSRNRFSLILQAIANGVEKLIIQLSYPYDEVGNPLMDLKELQAKKVNSFSEVYTLAQFRKLFNQTRHPFTNIDYLEFYQKIANCEIILANNPLEILKYTDQVLVASIHNRQYLKDLLLDNGGNIVYGLDDIMTSSIDGSGYNSEYGLLGSNIATNDIVKLFPRDCFDFVKKVQKEIFAKYHKKVEVMVYGDGAFKDPVGGIWELADPVVSPGYTEGLEGTPNELKFKYLADNELKDLNLEEAQGIMKSLIKNKDSNQNLNNNLGTTPRRFVDLLGSLADLTSGSGDKGTPIILIQNYFTNYSQD